MNKLKALKDYLKYNIQINKKIIKKFSEQILENPVHALEWSKEVFESSADLQVSEYFYKALEKNKTLNLNEIKQYLSSQILSDAQYSHNSTSVPSNFMNQELFKAYAKLYNWLKCL